MILRQMPRALCRLWKYINLDPIHCVWRCPKVFEMNIILWFWKIWVQATVKWHRWGHVCMEIYIVLGWKTHLCETGCILSLMNYNLNVKYPSFCRFVAFIPLAPETKTRFLHSFEIKPKKQELKQWTKLQPTKLTKLWAVNKTTTDQRLTNESNNQTQPITKRLLDGNELRHSYRKEIAQEQLHRGFD